MKNVYVLGSLNVDVFVELEKYPKPGETVLGKNVKTHFGGKGANQALACQYAGLKTKMIGCVGTDIEGAEMIKNLQQYHVDTRYVSQKEGTSGRAFIYLYEGDNQIVVSRGTNEMVMILDVEEALRNANLGDYFVVQLEVPVFLVEHSIRYAKEKGLITVLNPSPYQEFNIDILSYIDILIANETELKSLTKVIDFEEVKRLVKTIVLTLGKEGSILYQDDEIYREKGYQIEVLDTTAAGDSFLGHFLGFRDTFSGVELLQFANAAGALATTIIGAQNAIPKKEDVIKLKKEKHD